MLPRLTRLRAAAPQSLADVILDDTPLAFWRCDESGGSGTLADSSGNSRTLTLAGSVTTGVTAKNGRMGKCATFTTTGYGTVADSSPFRLTGDMTFECWVKLASTLTSAQVARLAICSISGETEATNVPYLFQLQESGGVQQFRCFHESGAGVDNNAPFNVSYTATDWNHWVATRDVTADVYELWLNGVSLGTQGFSADPTGGGSSVFEFGRNNGTSAISDVDRTIDEIAIYSSKLSAARIFEHYRAGRRS
jgi:hypothetical protein